jgi:hypothetical protein
LVLYALEGEGALSLISKEIELCQRVSAGPNFVVSSKLIAFILSPMHPSTSPIHTHKSTHTLAQLRGGGVVGA